MEITTVGIDLNKTIFQVHAVDAAGYVVVRKALRRAEVVRFFAKLLRCLVGMKAYGQVEPRPTCLSKSIVPPLASLEPFAIASQVKCR